MVDRKVIEVIPTVQRKIFRGEGYSEDGDASFHPEVDEEEIFDQKARTLVNAWPPKVTFIMPEISMPIRTLSSRI